MTVCLDEQGNPVFASQIIDNADINACTWVQPREFLFQRYFEQTISGPQVIPYPLPSVEASVSDQYELGNGFVVDGDMYQITLKRNGKNIVKKENRVKKVNR